MVYKLKVVLWPTELFAEGHIFNRFYPIIECKGKNIEILEHVLLWAICSFEIWRKCQKFTYVGRALVHGPSTVFWHMTT